MRKSISGYTLIEITIIVVVIGILAAVTFVSYGNVQARARDDRRRADIAKITKALELYYSDNGEYPDPTGTSSAISPEWYSSGDVSWDTFATQLNPAIKDMPKDPINNISANPTLSDGKPAYAYYTGNYCGQTSGQWYILVYRLEVMNKERFSDGTCSTNPIGDTYYNNGASYYRSVK